MLLKNSRFVVAIGFLLVLVLTALLMLMGYVRLNEGRKQLETVVNQHNVRVDLLFSMRNLVRERSLSLYAMYFSRDPFDRQDEYLHFSGMVDEFVALREQLLQVGLNEEEQRILARANALIRQTQPLQAGMAQQILQQSARGALLPTLQKDLALEKEILSLFDQIVEIERAQVKQAAQKTLHAHDNTVLLMQTLAPSTLLLGMLIAGFVSRQTQRAENAIHREKEQAEVTLHSIADAVITTDADNRVRYLNPVAERLTGWSKTEAQGKRLAEIYHVQHEVTRKPVDHPALLDSLDGPVVGLEQNSLLIARDGREFAVEDSVAPIRSHDNRISGKVLVFRDVSHARDFARQLSWQANHDALTGLPNRRGFETELNRLLETARTLNKQHALLYIDLDQFKLVNDTCGHVAGDELLMQLAMTLQAKIRNSDTLARLGGDEFGVLLDGCSPDKARQLADSLRQASEHFRFMHDGRIFKTPASIGLVCINADSADLHSLLSAADAACYMAKEKGRNRVWVHQPDDIELQQRHGEMQMISRLTHAVEENRFTLYTQAIEPLFPEKGRPPMQEILVRMLDEDGAIIMPGTFIPAAERYGIMPSIDRWVVRETCRQLARDNTPRPRIRSINVSNQSLSDDGFLDFVLRQFEESGIDPRLCCFEITETTAIANWNRATRFVLTLKGMGCHFALDDFGSGMASFAYLRDLPVDLVKIDGSFVRNIVNNRTDLAMVQAIHRIAHEMGIGTIAEFVESEAIRSALRGLNIDYLQGYAVHRPAPLSEPIILPTT
jgi:diguanylate cyclase (GGDEF)-like protein/PAS domain S-box-containing protein